MLSSECREGIYYSFRKPPLLTVVIGGSCSDGIALIADKKVSSLSGRVLRFEEKIRGDLAHILIGYAGSLMFFFVIMMKRIQG